MARGYFITGTDTGVGKTSATVSLMQYLKRQGNTVAGMKPVASGCTWYDGHLINTDALLIQQYCSTVIGYELINPYAYEQAVSPHIAGVDKPMQLPFIKSCFEQLQNCADYVLVEGAGGWYSPLSSQTTNADLAIALELPVILVVGMRLGCINHAHLSWQAIRQSGVPCKGWLALCVDSEMQALEANIDYLKMLMDIPLLGILPFARHLNFDEFSKYITIN
jgi:dethiobiotin synthetase